MGTAVSEINDEVEDIVGELTNIVVGGAKIEFAGLGYSFNISLPLLVSGGAHVIKHKHDSPVLVIPFTSRSMTAKSLIWKSVSKSNNVEHFD